MSSKRALLNDSGAKPAVTITIPRRHLASMYDTIMSAYSDAREITEENSVARDVFDYLMHSVKTHPMYAQALKRDELDKWFTRPSQKTYTDEKIDMMRGYRCCLSNKHIMNEIYFNPDFQISVYELSLCIDDHVERWYPIVQRERWMCEIRNGIPDPFVDIISKCKTLLVEIADSENDKEEIQRIEEAIDMDIFWQQLRSNTLDHAHWLNMLFEMLFLRYTSDKDSRDLRRRDWVAIANENIGEEENIESVAIKCTEAIYFLRTFLNEVRVIGLNRHYKRIAKENCMERRLLSIFEADLRKGKRTLSVLTKCLEPLRGLSTQKTIMANFLVETMLQRSLYDYANEKEIPETLYLETYRLRHVFNVFTITCASMAILLMNPRNSENLKQWLKNLVTISMKKDLYYFGSFEENLEYYKEHFMQDLNLEGLHPTNAVHALFSKRLKHTVMQAIEARQWDGIQEPPCKDCDVELLIHFDWECCRPMRRLATVQAQVYCKFYDAALQA